MIDKRRLMRFISYSVAHHFHRLVLAYVFGLIQAVAGAIKGFLRVLANCFEDIEMKDGKLKHVLPISA